MSYFEIFMLALALSVDACVVSFSYGVQPLNKPAKERTMLALFTGFFQALMPVIGYYLTTLAFDYVSPYAKYIVFVIFTLLGIKFIYEGISKKREEDTNICIGILCLFMIGIATSIDAFSAGISLRLFGNGILKPALLIGLVTVINSNIGFLLGKKLNNLPFIFLGFFSGLIMIALGIKALYG